MNNRQRFQAAMNYDSPGVFPVWHWSAWDETRDRWYHEELDPTLTTREDVRRHLCSLGIADGYFEMVPIAWNLYPEFEKRTIRETDEHVIYQQEDGVIVRSGKTGNSIPEAIEHCLKDRSQWPQYARRLDPTTPGRFPADWLEKARAIRQAGIPLAVFPGSLYGWLRNWIGLENLSMLIYDDPAFYEQYIDTVVNLAVALVETVCQQIEVDLALYWEDMCFANGPMISPEMFRRFMVPGYRRINEVLHRHNVNIIGVDSDGVVDDLVPAWLDAGVNCIFPMEVGTWQADVNDYRRRFGKDMLMIGGIDKRELAKGHAEIDAEIDRVRPLIEQGGYIPLPDHLIPPDVSWSNYVYYLTRMTQLSAELGT